jgi:hypothetical protein
MRVPLLCEAMAQRKGELLKVETLERVASLLPDLQSLAASAGLPTDARLPGEPGSSAAAPISNAAAPPQPKAAWSDSAKELGVAALL